MEINKISNYMSTEIEIIMVQWTVKTDQFIVQKLVDFLQKI